MKIVINGARVKNFATFIAEIAQELSSGDAELGYFGFDLDSFGDCLHGGYLGAPPYDIVVEHAMPMIAAMDHHGLIRYCDEMLAVIDGGGRGLVREDSRHWYENTRNEARTESGPTLLQLLMEVIQASPATLTLLDDNGSVVATSADESDEGSRSK